MARMQHDMRCPCLLAFDTWHLPPACAGEDGSPAVLADEHFVLRHSTISTKDVRCDIAPRRRVPGHVACLQPSVASQSAWTPASVARRTSSWEHHDYRRTWVGGRALKSQQNVGYFWACTRRAALSGQQSWDAGEVA